MLKGERANPESGKAFDVIVLRDKVLNTNTRGGKALKWTH
jgi:hypothetical protein